ncbi:oligogalacturonate-specific porin KdgM family protein [Vibrio sp. CK2-1]|uniref:oligogalacturonate-specific porin KdgM family protein n=1 Tax=Vibrio sp. CK2-1 TaxID=2912249 RepID=UPI001F1C8957|nr:oligogalacturonate-specific porin KdgM family protein [Vibrio sp. CK2-1]MCF7352570.1 oligogalacturonate-specific porin KdgM family protein [Vibrio sp. CK2-1]
MFKLNKVLLATTAALLATTAVNVNAASVDYRHEYKHGTESNGDRIKIGGSTKVELGTHYYSVEMKFNGKSESYGYQDLERGDSEFVYEFKHYITDKFYVQPGMPITFGEERVTYKPQLRIGYDFDSGITTKLRYRHEFRDYTDDSKYNGDTWQKSKVTANLDYTWNNMIQFGFEANYEKAHEDIWTLYDNDTWNYDYNLKIGYKNDSNWRPYVEFGNVSESSSTDKRQLRSRVGITYSF